MKSTGASLSADKIKLPGKVPRELDLLNEPVLKGYFLTVLEGANQIHRESGVLDMDFEDAF